MINNNNNAVVVAATIVIKIGASARRRRAEQGKRMWPVGVGRGVALPLSFDCH